MNPKKQATKAKKGSFWKEFPVMIAIALVLAFVINTWVVQPFFIPSGSMENTLKIGDRVFVNKVVYQIRDIERGDVIVFAGSESWDEDIEVAAPEPTNAVSAFFTWVGRFFGIVPTGKDYTKRVIGLPGDTVECCDAQNRVLVNGVALEEESYLYPGSVQSHRPFGPVEVGEGRLWVMGDHRAISYDSRRHDEGGGDGTIPVDSVIGRAFAIHWPLDRVGLLSPPETFAALNEETAESAAESAAATP